MKTYPPFFLVMALVLCACAGKKDLTEVKQDKTMMDRYWGPPDPNERARHSMYDGKPYTSAGAAGVREFRGLGSFSGSKDAPVKSFYSKDFRGLEEYGGKNKKFAASENLYSKKTNSVSQSPYGSQEYDGDTTYRSADTRSNYSGDDYKTRSAVVEGKTSTGQLDNAGRALRDKIDKKELTIEQVRELLNKSR